MQYNHAGYYQQACVMPQHQQMGPHSMSPQVPPCHSPLQQLSGGAQRSPVASPDPSQGSTGGNGGLSVSQLQHMGSNSMEGSPEETITELDANGQPVIYPWMKKIHVAGVGRCFQVRFLRKHIDDTNVTRNQTGLLKLLTHSITRRLTYS